MAFAWTPIGAGTIHLKSHIQEVKNNTNTLYSKLQLSPFAWSYLANVDALTTIESEHYQEMRNAVDYAHDMNYCRAYDASDNGTIDSTNRATVNSGYNGSIYSSYNTGVFSGDRNSVNSSHNSSVYSLI